MQISQSIDLVLPLSSLNNSLQRNGWRRDTLPIGTVIKVDGFLARNGSDRVNARSVTIAGTGERPGATLDADSSQRNNN
mgnify:CR=1 FL=1